MKTSKVLILGALLGALWSTFRRSFRTTIPSRIIHLRGLGQPKGDLPCPSGCDPILEQGGVNIYSKCLRKLLFFKEIVLLKVLLKVLQKSTKTETKKDGTKKQLDIKSSRPYIHANGRKFVCCQQN